VGVRALADATQNRPDNSQPGSRSEVILDVDTRDDYDRRLGAYGLWATCQQTVDGVAMQSFEALGDGRFAIVVEPALGTNAEERLIGCLEDFTIDRVVGGVTSVRDLEPVPGSVAAG
ncbi:MAG: hypothetical protein ACRDY6_23650, partial [Acidimicrobiia bacterium]